MVAGDDPPAAHRRRQRVPIWLGQPDLVAQMLRRAYIRSGCSRPGGHPPLLAADLPKDYSLAPAQVDEELLLAFPGGFNLSNT